MGRACACALMLFVLIFVLTQFQSLVGARKTVDID